MEALRKVALAYYNSGTDEERRLFNQFFQSMDKDGNRRVSYREFSDFMSQKAHDENMRTRDFFNQLDIDGSGRLDFKEVLTLYYILKSRRPICGRCRIFITNEYFACMRCFETGSAAYSICLECFGDKGSLNHNHVRSYFVDNFSLLESLRKKPLPNHQPSSRSSRSCSRSSRSSRSCSRSCSRSSRSSRSCSRSSRNSRRHGTSRRRRGHSSKRAIVPYNQNIPAEGRGLWQAALKVFEAALPIAGIVAGCSIM
ncbi:calcium-binding EF-hand family protein [Citrus sinensis]|uniref:uncharacterized protein LOC102622719 isoform X2 n=1 Tax=Citrus sinensis TaxID=2711 RepID=UPI000763A4D3|nr:uncharacterized protein LOC102622719 isoform X2 [Citrus sinensis]KAH9765339.1 calcium-binding EF-hand family protein [Citrus sinensis]